MHIKYIDLVGFKSFVDKTRLSLEPGISCVVGPNGSGKSNVSDAVRWVFGEQNARHLRGQKMEDVIFSGSGKRKATSMAEVSLTIDNSDGKLPLEFGEITVVRRAYRSGDSEYLINGKSCRLKDIYNLFVDSGITADSFSMVGQGRIHELVNMKPEERRNLIDEAAGIVRYRNRKKEAVRKLENTQRNLERVADVIGELADRLGPLQQQAQKATSYLELTGVADALEISLLAQNLKEYQTRLETNQQNQAEMEKRIAEQDAAIGAAEAQSEELRLEMARLNEAANQRQQDFLALTTMREKTEARIGVAQAQKNAARENILRLEQELASLSDQDEGFLELASAKEASQQALTEKIAGLQQQSATAQQQLEEAKEAADGWSDQLEAAREEAFELANEQARLKNELSYQRQLLENAQRALLRVQQTLAAQQSAYRDQDTEKQKIAAALEEAARSLQEKKSRLADLEQQQLERQKQQQQAGEQEVALRFQLNSLQSRVQALSELKERYEGYYPGVRTLLQQAKQGRLSGIVGVMAELLEVQPGCETAFDAALGAGLQNIVTRSERDAREAISYLKQHRGGRVTLLPLDALRPKKNSAMERALGLPGVVGRAIDLVRCEQAVRPAAEFLLNNLLVTKTLEDASRAAKAAAYQCRIVTLEGDMINPGGAMSGGSREKSSSDLLARKEELQRLKKQAAQIEKDYQQAQAVLTKLKAEEAAAQQQSQELRLAQQQGELARLALEKDLQHWQDLASGRQKEQENLEWEQQQQAQQAAELTASVARLQENLAGWETQNQQANATIAAIQQQWEQAKGILEEKRETAGALQVELARLEQESFSLTAEIKRLREEKTDLFTAVAQKNQALAQFQQQLQRCTEEYERARQELQSLEQRSHGEEQSILQMRNRLQEMESQAALTEQQARALRRDSEAAKEELHRLEVKLARIETELANEENKLREGFSLTLEEALPKIDETLSRTETSKQVKELRRQIAALGTVNVDAIEEFQQVNERYTFLTSQKQDLEEARVSLEKVIREMDSIMNSRFKKAAAAVSSEFGKVFSRLFGGGHAALELTDPENLLETGVELVVEPPGKRLTNYNLLSGGEKALIGIALMFAIFHVNPSPFCVLDEVDAALDEANVERFGEYLQELSASTQFLLISHRQGTMEAAQALYGVTMEEEGISKVVSVKLTDVAQAS